MALQITAAPADAALLDLPWMMALEDWPASHLVSLPRGISRHVVRFVRVSDTVYAVKELPEHLARREFGLLRTLERSGEPVVHAVGIVTGRESVAGEPLEPALVTRHLEFSLPYRFLFSGSLQPDTVTRLLDALTALLVRLHLTGFYWGDCSLSNVLFRRDAGAFAAHLVDAETGERHGDGLTPGQRAHDVEIARLNIAGELLDLDAGGLLHQSVDPVDTSDQVERRYGGLWHELHAAERVPATDRHLIEARIRRLQRLGFDVDELTISETRRGSEVVFQPQVVEPGHHSRRLLQLTGLDVQENQARRLLSDLAAFTAVLGDPGESEEITAHRWLRDAFQATVARIPTELRGRLEPAEIYHEVLEHRWYLSEGAGEEVDLAAATDDYVANVLTSRPDEAAVLGADLTLSD